jgi:NDP-sugar pyrophosphorylase family protein
MSSRKLTAKEIETLRSQGCASSAWDRVEVTDGFNTRHIFGTFFSGDVKIGKFESQPEGLGITNPGLYHSVIRDCIIEDNVRIADVKLIQGYLIQNGAVIERTGEISMTGESKFGNGQVIDILNEGGGRELPIFSELSSQVAYITVLYQHDQELSKALRELILRQAGSVKSGTGTISANAKIKNAGIIRNVNIGESAIIDGPVMLAEGTVESCAEDPAKIGEGVTARNFIIHHGSVVESCAMLDKVFVGQGVRIGKQFSAENSAFFANCEGFHGEAVSLFAGPYTVTHHKSTLLIAAMASFYNAGSGTNQSNHMYKLGPLHQGILERGAKTGSYAYLLWPCRVGAFSVVMGKHLANFDTSEFPFSYLNVEDEKSFLTPGMNLITVGTRRDVEKWPSRDRRKTKNKLDLITFDWLNPMIIQRSVGASRILNELYEKTDREQESVTYKGIRIKRLLLKSCRKYYDMVLPVFLGEQLIRRSDAGKPLKPGSQGIPADESWIDLGGMITTRTLADSLLDEIKSGRIKSTGELNEKLVNLNASYDDMAWNWSLSILAQKLGKEIRQIGEADFLKVIQDWKDNKIRLNNMILSDAKKEFDQSSKIGFGIDGDDAVRDKDFQNVRGTYEGNKFVKGILDENKKIETKAGEMISLLNR